MLPVEHGSARPWLRCVKGGDERPSLGRLAEIRLLDEDSAELTPEFRLSPSMLQLSAGCEALAEFAIGTDDNLHVSVKNCTVVLAFGRSRYDYVYASPDGTPVVVVAGENLRLTPRISKGALRYSGAWRRDRSDAIELHITGNPRAEAVIQIHERPIREAVKPDFVGAAHTSKVEFENWARADGQHEAHRLAKYVLWANTVPARGCLTRPSVLMSKNWMTNIWSWDNAFSALGLAAIDPELAIDQFMAIYDHQDISGLLPDFVNDQQVSFAFTKPPVHGWAVKLIQQRYPGWAREDQMTQLAHHIERQVSYWLDHARASDADLPFYTHGNDSGWDNASFFEFGGPVISPDLPAFLISALDLLAEQCSVAGAQTASDQFVAGADELTKMLLSQLWNGETFTCQKAHEPDAVLPVSSLIQFVPLIIGDRLPDEIANLLVDRLTTSHFLTEYGPATEQTDSEFYKPNGYWRGPIWAPTTLLLFDGLRQQGQADLAVQIARNFCATVRMSGMSENFNAKTGEALVDPAFAWTAAVYLFLEDAIQFAD